MSEGASSGPTGMPWIDSNGWKIRLLSTQQPGKTIWIESKPSASNDVVPIERYLIGMADAASHGGRWILKVDSMLARSVAGKEQAALANWQRIAGAVRFFQSHPALFGLPARAVTAVVSDFAGANEYLSHEILNLAARQQLPCLMVDKTRFRALPAGLKAAVYADEQAPGETLRSRLQEFVRSGGVLVTSKAWGSPAGTPLPDSPSVRYTLHQVGAGRIAIAGEGEMTDPYLVAADTQVLLSHRYDLVRLWNGGSLGAYPTGDARRTIVHFVNYSGQPSRDPVSFWIAGDFRSVALHSFEFREPHKLPIVRRRNGVEVHLPQFATYAALEVSQ